MWGFKSLPEYLMKGSIMAKSNIRMRTLTEIVHQNNKKDYQLEMLMIIKNQLDHMQKYDIKSVPLRNKSEDFKDGYLEAVRIMEEALAPLIEERTY